MESDCVGAVERGRLVHIRVEGRCMAFKYV